MMFTTPHACLSHHPLGLTVCLIGDIIVNLKKRYIEWDINIAVVNSLIAVTQEFMHG
jgi:hypothetical protein